MPSSSVIQNIVGQSSKYDLAKISLSYTQNMYEETVDSNESSTTKILKSIPGVGQNKINTSDRYMEIEGKNLVRGMFITSECDWCKDTVTYVVIGKNLYMYYNNTLMQICKVADGIESIHFAECQSNGSFDKYMVLVDGITMFAIDIDEPPLMQRQHVEQILLPERFNANDNTKIKPTHVAYLYGYIVVNDKDSDFFYLSYQYPFNVYKSGTEQIDKNIFEVGSEQYGNKGHYVMAEWQPDDINALCSNNSRLFVFGKKSYQVFQYTNDINNPFSSPDTAAKKIGLMEPESLSQIGEYTMWLGSSDVGNLGIFLNINGSTESQRVSTYSIEQQLAKATTFEDVSSTMYQEKGHIFYLLSVPDIDTTFCYDIKENSWSNRNSYDKANLSREWNYRKIVSDDNGKIWSAYVATPKYDTNTGKYKSMVFFGELTDTSNLDYVDEELRPIVRKRRGGIISNNNKHFYINNIEFHMNNGQTTWIENENKPGRISLSYSVDGATWTDKELVEIGGQGEYDWDAIFYNLGLGKYFAVEVSCSDDCPFGLYNMNIQFDLCNW